MGKVESPSIQRKNSPPPGYRLLFLSRWFPYPPNNGSKIRILNLIKQLQRGYKVDLITYTDRPVTKGDMRVVRSICDRVWVRDWKPYRPDSIKALLGFFSMNPRSVVDRFDPKMMRLVQKVGMEDAVDLVIASEIDMGIYAQGIHGKPKLLEDLELAAMYDQFAKNRNPLHKIRYFFTWMKTKQYINQLLRNFEVCTVVSELEKALVGRAAPYLNDIEIIANGVNSEELGKFRSESSEPFTIIYAGAMTYSANLDAVRYFLREIFPLIRKDCPRARFTVTGSFDNTQVSTLPDLSGVNLTGHLEDVRPAIANSWISVVPLREGGGTRLKILESLAIGTPVVSTSKGAEGLQLIHGEEIFIADRPSEFAEFVLRIFNDSSLRSRMSEKGRIAVSQRYDWSGIGQSLASVIEKILTS